MSSLIKQKDVNRYVLTSLGSPTIDVEITDDQITELTQQALGIYGTYKPIEKFAQTPVIAAQQKYLLPAGSFGKGILEVFQPDMLRQPISLDQFDVFKYHANLPNLDPGDFYAERIWWKEVRRSSGSDEDWIVEDNNDGTAYIYITPLPSESYALGFIAVFDPTLSTVPISDDDFIKEYVLAMSMEVVGRIRRKFRAVTGAEESIEMDGAELVQEGAEKREKLEEYINNRGAIVAPIRG